MAKAQGMATTFSGMSAALGTPYVATPRQFLEFIGAPPTARRVMASEMVGVREFVVAAGLMADKQATRWLAMRVGGDIMDIAMVGLAMLAPDTDRRKLAMALAALLGVTATDVAATLKASKVEQSAQASESGPGESTPSALAVGDGSIHRSVTIGRTPQEIYDFWRNLENLPTFMRHLQEVDAIDELRSHWVAKAPMGATVEWDAEITDDVPGRSIAWRSLEGSQIWSSGRVDFVPAPSDRGSEVHVQLKYAPPFGPVGVAVARILGEEPASQISGDLRRLKQVMETGEVSVSEATIDGKRIRQRPAQPVSIAA